MIFSIRKAALAGSFAHLKRRLGLARLLPAMLWLGVMTTFAAALGLPEIPGVRFERLSFEKLPGWAGDDHLAAWRTWLKSCRANVEGAQPLRAGTTIKPALAALCKKALAAPATDAAGARRFFETHFAPWTVLPDGKRGFFTGYYEPEIEGSLTPTQTHQVPIFDRPADLVALPDGQKPPGLEQLVNARRLPDGTLAPYPDRGEIEAGALQGRGLERVFIADPVDRFFLQVQGSGRIRLADGSILRLAYAGRNGHPYTSIGKVVAERSGIKRRDMTMAVLRRWLAQDKTRAGQVMRANKSFVFFRIATELDPQDGPIGAQGVPLTAGRSMAVDRTLWAYGLPIFVEADLPFGKGGADLPFRRLMIAQDTGSAILGPARGDLFMGSGRQAGDKAGAVQHPGGFVVLWPNGGP